MHRETRQIRRSVVLALAALLQIASCGGGTEVTMISVGSEAGSSTQVPGPDNIGEFEVIPEMIYMEPPHYPRSAKQAGVTGTVLVAALVDSSGRVREAIVLKSSESTLLDNAAIMAAYKCRFKPAIKNGETAACWVNYKVEFVLDK